MFGGLWSVAGRWAVGGGRWAVVLYYAGEGGILPPSSLLGWQKAQSKQG